MPHGGYQLSSALYQQHPLVRYSLIYCGLFNKVAINSAMQILTEISRGNN